MASDNPFWDYSVAVYRKPGVADACLRLQDDAGVDVNLLLFLCWLSLVRDRPLGESEIRDLLARTDAWRERVVRPLREVRRWMKGAVDGLPAESVETLRAEVKRIELQSERVQQDLLLGMEGSGHAPITDDRAARQRATENIQLYLKVIGFSDREAVADACRLVIMAGVSA